MGAEAGTLIYVELAICSVEPTPSLGLWVYIYIYIYIGSIYIYIYIYIYIEGEREREREPGFKVMAPGSWVVLKIRVPFRILFFFL